MCEEEGTEKCEKGVKESSVVGFLRQHLCWVPTWRLHNQRAQQHFPISPAVFMWHIGPAVGCGYLPARHVRGDPIGSPSCQLFSRNGAGVNNRNRQSSGCSARQKWGHLHLRAYKWIQFSNFRTYICKEKILIHRMVFIFNLSVDVQIFNFQFCA